MDQEHQEIFSAIVEVYCRWIASSPFPFDYCDVLGRRLETIFAIGSIGDKSEAVLAAAQLGSSHNRWFVMNILLECCGATLAANVARRIAIEIQLNQAEAQFRRCAEGVSRSVNIYHPLIAAVLSQ